MAAGVAAGGRYGGQSKKLSTHVFNGKHKARNTLK